MKYLGQKKKNNVKYEKSSDSDDSEFVIKRGASKKKELFVAERDNIIKKMDELLGLTEKNRLICANDISDDTKKKIIELIPDIKKFYTYSNWKCFRDSINDYIENCVYLIRAIYKDDGYSIETISMLKNRNGNKVTVSVLKIYK